MNNKRGETEIQGSLFIYILFGALIALALFPVIIKFFSLQKESTNVLCGNSQWWDGENGVKAQLEKLDSDNSIQEQTFFVNDDCKIVSFSLIHGLNDITYPKTQPNEPLVCLCSVETDLIGSGGECKPYDCYKLKNYDQVNEKQFSTLDLKDFTNLIFRKEGRTLSIEALAEEKTPELLTYKSSDLTKEADKNLIESISILFKTRKIRSFLPIVNIKETNFLIPKEITNIEAFTLFFDMNLAISPELYTADYIKNPQKIDPEQVDTAIIQLKIPKSKLEKLSDFQKKNLLLYYKHGEKWQNSNLICEISQENFLCNSSIKGFSNNFAISAVKDINREHSAAETNKGGTRQNPPNLIILHHTGGSLKITLETFSDPNIGTSSHYVLDKDGTLYNIVPDLEIANHAKGLNNRAIGIEIVNKGHKSDPYTKEQYESIKRLITHLTETYNFPLDDNHIKGYYEVSVPRGNKWDPSPNFDWSQIGLPNHPKLKEIVDPCTTNIGDYGYNCQELKNA